jgi:hypothetical protein
MTPQTRRLKPMALKMFTSMLVLSRRYSGNSLAIVRVRIILNIHMKKVRFAFPNARETGDTYFSKVMATELTKDVKIK